MKRLIAAGILFVFVIGSYIWGYVFIKDACNIANKYLEECIQSLVSQKIKSKIIVCTSTPCEYIENIAKKYSLPYYIKTTKSDIQDDWNFAYNKADTDWVTVAHQDDIYNEEYSKVILETAKKYDDINMIYTDYMPILNGKTGKRDKNSKIKKVLRCPLLIPGFNKIKFVKKMTLALGNTICCPTVTYNKKRVGDTIFVAHTFPSGIESV